MIEMNIEVIGERKVRLRRIDLHAIDFRKVVQLDLARNHEVAQQMRIRRRARQHVDEEAVERFGLLGRRQQIDIVAGGDRFGFGRRQNFLVADHQRRLRP